MTINEFFKNDRFATEAGVELLEVRSGYARARMELTPKHLNGGGVCQGGAIFTLADLAAAAALNSHGRLTLSVTATVNFLQAESSGYLYAQAQEIFDRGRLAHCQVRITNQQEELVAIFTTVGYHKEQQLPFTPVE